MISFEIIGKISSNLVEGLDRCDVAIFSVEFWSHLYADVESVNLIVDCGKGDVALWLRVWPDKLMLGLSICITKSVIWNCIWIKGVDRFKFFPKVTTVKETSLKNKRWVDIAYDGIRNIESVL